MGLDIHHWLLDIGHSSLVEDYYLPVPDDPLLLHGEIVHPGGQGGGADLQLPGSGEQLQDLPRPGGRCSGCRMERGAQRALVLHVLPYNAFLEPGL